MSGLQADIPQHMDEWLLIDIDVNRKRDRRQGAFDAKAQAGAFGECF